MDTKHLSNYQLYEIIQNDKIDFNIRNLANVEFINRKLSLEEVQLIIAKHDLQFKPEMENGLKLSYKLILILFPFFFYIHSLIAGRILAEGNKIKWKEYWKYICFGYLLWTLIVILFSKYFLFRPDI